MRTKRQHEKCQRCRSKFMDKGLKERHEVICYETRPPKRIRLPASRRRRQWNAMAHTTPSRSPSPIARSPSSPPNMESKIKMWWPGGPAATWEADREERHQGTDHNEYKSIFENLPSANPLNLKKKGDKVPQRNEDPCCQYCRNPTFEPEELCYECEVRIHKLCRDPHSEECPKVPCELTEEEFYRRRKARNACAHSFTECLPPDRRGTLHKCLICNGTWRWHEHLKIWEVYDKDGLHARLISPLVDNKESPRLRANPSRENDEAEERTMVRTWTEELGRPVPEKEDGPPHQTLSIQTGV